VLPTSGTTLSEHACLLLISVLAKALLELLLLVCNAGLVLRAADDLHLVTHTLVGLLVLNGETVLAYLLTCLLAYLLTYSLTHALPSWRDGVSEGTPLTHRMGPH
jgi:hypothetical protein